MATVGRGAYAPAVHTFWDGLRTFDAEKACAVLADDAEMTSPWNDGTIEGRDAIQETFAGLLGDAATRPSLTIIDLSGDGHVTRILASVSGRFGAGPQHLRFTLLHLKGRIHDIQVAPA